MQFTIVTTFHLFTVLCISCLSCMSFPFPPLLSWWHLFICHLNNMLSSIVYVHLMAIVDKETLNKDAFVGSPEIDKWAMSVRCFDPLECLFDMCGNWNEQCFNGNMTTFVTPMVFKSVIIANKRKFDFFLWDTILYLVKRIHSPGMASNLRKFPFQRILFSIQMVAQTNRPMRCDIEGATQ